MRKQSEAAQKERRELASVSREVWREAYAPLTEDEEAACILALRRVVEEGPYPSRNSLRFFSPAYAMEALERLEEDGVLAQEMRPEAEAAWTKIGGFFASRGVRPEGWEREPQGSRGDLFGKALKVKLKLQAEAEAYALGHELKSWEQSPEGPQQEAGCRCGARAWVVARNGGAALGANALLRQRCPKSQESA